MADLIDREALIDSLNKFAPEKYDALVNMLIKKAPRVVEATKHARWLGDWGSYRCSECHEYSADDGWARSNYCPNCGAKMDLEDDYAT